jgi:hypothetical protein
MFATKPGTPKRCAHPTRIKTRQEPGFELARSVYSTYPLADFQINKTPDQLARSRFYQLGVTMDAEAIYRVMKFGTAAERKKLVLTLPPDPMRDIGITLLDSDRPGMAIVALGTVTLVYCNGSEPTVGRELALALHRYAVELFDGAADHQGLLPTTLSNLAQAYINASNLIGRSEDAAAFAEEYIPYYATFEPENIRSLKLGRIEALLNLNRLDDASDALEDPMLPGNPISDIQFDRLRRRMAQLRTSITDDRLQGVAPGPSEDDLIANVQSAMSHVFKGSEDEEVMSGLINQLAGHRRLDANNPDDFKSLLEVLKKSENFMRREKEGEDSQLSIRGRIREASGIFALQATPPRETLAKSLAELTTCLAWADANGVIELQNDAHWGIYLCYSRLNDPSAASDALLKLRSNLEAARAAITDQTRRGGAFALYPHLFAALVEKLFKANRIPEMLEAIEASKGRGVADLLTRRSKKAIADESIYGSTKRVPSMCRDYGFHYLTYFVDDDVTYAVVVTSDGELHAPKPVTLSRATIRQAASPVTPQTAETLSPLLGWLPGLMKTGSVAPGSHFCIAVDDDLANVPFSCLLVNGKPLAETMSMSRIHNAFHLSNLLEAPAKRPASYLGVVVASKDNAASSNWERMNESLHKPIARLAETLPGETIEGKKASLSVLTARDLRRQTVHFSTHGMYPKKDPAKGPFDYAGLLLSDGSTLPDTKKVDYKSVLTPRVVFERGMDLTGSHISMMACVSGLSREGAGGDALGMEWAMIQAGAASVLSTHWDVSAQLAAAFVDLFYEHWIQKKKSRGKALSDTIATLRKAGGDGAATASWAAFSLTGDWR